MEEAGQEVKKGVSKRNEEYKEWKGKRRPEGRIPNKVQVTIVDMMGKAGCTQGYKIGDTWVMEPHKTPNPQMCAQVYDAIRMAIVGMGFGGEFPWNEKDVTWFCCPDPSYQLIYEIRRLDEKCPVPAHYERRAIKE
jgi:uncharacterized repeat protein (TIGR04076 family)